MNLSSQNSQNLDHFTIVKADIDNLEELLILENSCFKGEDIFSKRQIKRLLTSHTVVIFISYFSNNSGIKNGYNTFTKINCNNKKLAGYVIGLMRHFKIPSARIYKIGVLPEFRHMRLALHLLLYIENIFKAKGMKKIFAEVRKSNIPSQNLFIKAGYDKISEIKNYYKNGETAIKFLKIISSS